MFFDGEWKGEGQVTLSPPLRWFLPTRHFQFRAKPTWLSEHVWMVDEEYRFADGLVLKRRMYVAHVAPARLHLTADDMPLGADVTLEPRGFRFAPYNLLVPHWGRLWRFRCQDVNIVDEAGIVHDRVTLYRFGLPIAVLTLTSKVDRSGVA